MLSYPIFRYNRASTPVLTRPTSIKVQEVTMNLTQVPRSKVCSFEMQKAKVKGPDDDELLAAWSVAIHQKTTMEVASLDLRGQP